MMFDIKIEPGKAFQNLEDAAAGIADASPLMRAIAAEFESQTEANFEAEGRPAWLGLKPSTKAQRERQGTWPGKILQRSAGGLAPSIESAYDSSSSEIGSNKVYAAIQHLGGNAGRDHKTIIPARPYLPMDALGNMQPEVEEGVMSVTNDYLRTLFS
jgi:phage virion morphogenesis protein